MYFLRKIFDKWVKKQHGKKFFNKNDGYHNYFVVEWDKYANHILNLINHRNIFVRTWARHKFRIDQDKEAKGKLIDEILPYGYFVDDYKGHRKFVGRCHTKYAKRLYYGFFPIWWTLHFIDWLLLERFEMLPNFGFTTLTQYPQAGMGGANVTCDGIVRRSSVDETFATIRAGAGTHVDDTANDYPAGMFASVTTNQFIHLYRSAFMFDLSAIAIGADTINSLVFSVYVNNYTNGLGNDVNYIVDVTPTANNTLATGDYGNFTTTLLSDGNITDNAPTNGAYNGLTFNATGLSKIANITKIGMRGGWDKNNSFAGSWSNGLRSSLTIYFADQTGTTTDPKVDVDYTLLIPTTNYLRDRGRSRIKLNVPFSLVN